MPALMLRSPPRLLFLAFFLQYSVQALAVEQPHTCAEKNVTLHFYTTEVKPQCVHESRHYLIVNNSGYYNSVFLTCAENQGFVNFWGWDNGKYTKFTPRMYKYWAELPERLS